jgi:hypothetical protein
VRGGADDPEDAAGLGAGGGAGGEAREVLLDRGLVETIDIAEQVRPFEGDPGGRAMIGVILLLHEREERTADLAAVGGIGGVMDEPGGEPCTAIDSGFLHVEVDYSASLSTNGS